MENRQLITTQHIRKIENRTMEFIISDGTVDAHRSILNPGGWDLRRFEKNGIFSYNHNVENADPDYILGSARAYIEDDKLIGVGTFETEDVNPLAEKIFKKVKAGTLKAVSVGFIGKKSHRNEEGVVVYDEMELLEFSIVNLPSNPNAIKRGFGENRKSYINLYYL